MRVIINHEQMPKPEYRNRYSIFQHQLIFINAFVSTIYFLPYAHSCRGLRTQLWTLIRPPCTQLGSLYVLLQPKLWTYRLRSPLDAHITSHLTKNYPPST